MSISVLGNTNFKAYTNTIPPQQVYLSTTYALTGERLFVQYKTPIQSFTNAYITSYCTDFGENNPYVISPTQDTVFHSYSNAGTYYVAFSALYSDGSISSYNLSTPIIIESLWNKFNPEQLRLISHTSLTLPYTIDQVYIQPNEWGVEDIFNTSILRTEENLQFLINATQAINTNSPTTFFGWLGSNTNSLASGIKWFTQSYNQYYVKYPQEAESAGSSYFTNIKDSVQKNNNIFVLDGSIFRAFSAGAIPQEFIFKNTNEISSMLVNPVSLDIDSTGTYAFVADPAVNKVYKFLLDLSVNPQIDIQLFTGGYGSAYDHDKFNSPTEISYNNGYVYVLDYNNQCVKQYNEDLNWIYTYTCKKLDSDQPISVDPHPSGSFVYVLSKSYNIYVFDNLKSEPIATIPIPEVNDNTNLIKILFDESGDFYYILTEKNIYKYSITNVFISIFDISKNSTVNYVNIKRSDDYSLLISSPKCILKCQDILNFYQIGQGLPYSYWNQTQLKVSEDELVTDLNYNRSLIRMAQNIKSFRDTINAQFVIVTEQTSEGYNTFYTKIPIDVSQLPKLGDDIENETLGVGVNEFNIPQVLNRELEKLYNAIIILKNFLSLNEVSSDFVNNIDCGGQFCWSWKAMSCYNLTLPTIRNCSTNPITYSELTSDFPISNYAPTKTWGQATSNCCS